MAKTTSTSVKYVDFITRDEKEVKAAEVSVAVKKAAIQVDVFLNHLAKLVNTDRQKQ